ncbi:diguanylate cyclase domain-containing protein, partial [Mycobacterium kansasii]
TDQLTALPNRRSLATALTALSASASPGKASSRRALLLLNLHRLREINDSVGRHFGDELLWHIANRLTHNARRDDLLAR